MPVKATQKTSWYLFLCGVYCCIQALQTAQCAKSFHARIHTHTLTQENKIQASIQVFLNSFKSCPLNKSRFMQVPYTTASCSLGVSMSFDKQLTCHHASHAYYIHITIPQHFAHTICSPRNKCKLSTLCLQCWTWVNHAHTLIW